MQTVKFNEVLKLAGAIESAIRSNLSESRNNLTCSYCIEEQENKVMPETSMSEILTKNHELFMKQNEIKKLIAKTNREVTTKFEDQIFTLDELMMLRKELSTALGILKSMAYTSQLTRRVVSNGKVEFTEATFNVKSAKESLKTTEARLRLIDSVLDSANTSVSVDVEPAWFEI